MTRLSATTPSTGLAASTAKSQSDRDQDRRDATVASDLLATQFSSLLAVRIQTLTNRTSNSLGESTASNISDVSRRQNRTVTLAAVSSSARNESSNRTADRSAGLNSGSNAIETDSSDTKQRQSKSNAARSGEKPDSAAWTPGKTTTTRSSDDSSGRSAVSSQDDSAAPQASVQTDVRQDSSDRDVSALANRPENGAAEPAAVSGSEQATATGDSVSGEASTGTNQSTSDSAAVVEGAVETAQVATAASPSGATLDASSSASVVSQTAQSARGEASNTGVTEPPAAAVIAANVDAVQSEVPTATGKEPGQLIIGNVETKSSGGAAASPGGKSKTAAGEVASLIGSGVSVEVVASVEPVSINPVTPVAAPEAAKKPESGTSAPLVATDATGIASQAVAKTIESTSADVIDGSAVIANTVAPAAAADDSTGSNSTGSQSEQNGDSGSPGDDSNNKNGFVPANAVHNLANEPPAAFLAGLFNAGVVANGSISDSSVATGRSVESSTTVKALSAPDGPGSSASRIDTGHLTHGGGFAQRAHGAATVTEQLHVNAPSELVARVAEGVRQSLRTGNELRITLAPEELGRVHINVTSSSGVVSAQIEAQTAVGHATLLENLSQLKDALVQQGIAVDRLEVTRSDRGENSSDQRSGSGSSGGGAFGNGQQSRQEFAGQRELQVPVYSTGNTAKKSGQNAATPHSNAAMSRRLDIQA